MSANGAMNDDTDTTDGPEVEVVGPETVEVERPTQNDDAKTPVDRPAGEDRKTRRANKLAETERERDAVRAELAARDERLNRMEREAAEMRGYLAAQAQRQQQDPNATPEKRIEALEDEAQLHLERAAQAAANKDAEGQRREMRAYNAKLREANVLAVRSAMDPQINERFQQFQQNQPDPQLQHALSTVAQEFPDITTDAEFQGAADAAYRRLVAAGRPPNNVATFREAVAGAAKRLGIGGRPAPATNGTRARYGGVPAGEGGGGERRVVTIVDDRANRVLAAKSFPKDDKETAWKKFQAMVAADSD